MDLMPAGDVESLEAFLASPASVFTDPASWDANLRPPVHLSLPDWADAHFYLSAESAADPGPWTTLPYQRGWMDAMTDPAIEQVTVMKSARVGYTKSLNAAVGYYMEHDPCPIMVVQPTIDDAKGYSLEEVGPMLRDCPSLARIVPASKTRDRSNTLLRKMFPGGTLDLVGANSGRGFRRKSRRVVMLDEVDAYPLSAGVEGDPVKLAIRRTEYYWNRKIIAGSTPLLAGLSRIERLFLQGDQRRYYVPCPSCGAFDYLTFRREAVNDHGEPVGHFMHWPKGKPEAAHFICRSCDHEIAHREKRAIVEAGEWRAAAPSLGHASFHIWAAYSYSPNATWGQIAQEFVDSHQAGPEELKTFVNTVLGETWKETGEAPDWERLYARRDAYAIGTCPRGVLFVTIGVDVQKNYFIYEVVGWGRGKRSWSIDAGILEGETSDTSDKGPWPQLEALLERSYPSWTGVPLTPMRLAIDSGFNTQVVYDWARRYPLTRVLAVKGVDAGNALISAPSVVDVTAKGRKLKRGYRVWPVCGAIAKSELYGFLRLRAPTDEERETGSEDPPGYCRFPQHADEYFKQLTSEQLVRTKKRLIWQVMPGRLNHGLDARVYARAAAAVVGIDRFQERDWVVLENAIGMLPDTPRPEPPAGGSTPAPASSAPPTPSTPSSPAKRRWVPSRSGSWLRGRR